MDLLQLTLVVALAGLLTVEVVTFATTREHPFPRWFPWLLVAVTGFGLLFSAAAYRGWLVVSPELGLLMIEGGRPAYASIVILTLSCAVSVGLLVASVGHAISWPMRVLWPLAGSGVVAAFVVASIHTLNPGDSAELQIAVYDLWSPPLALWLSLSLVESTLRTLGVRRLSLRLCGHLFALGAITLAAMGRPEFVQPGTASVWRYIAVGSIALGVGLVPLWVWLVLRHPGVTGRGPRRVATLTLGWWIILGIAVWIWPQHRGRGAWVLWAATLLAIAISIVWRLRRADPSEGAPSPILARPPLRPLLAHAILGAGLFLVQIFEPTIVTIGVFLAWVILAESTGNGACARQARKLRAADQSPEPKWLLTLALTAGWKAAWGGLKKGFESLGNVFKGGAVSGILKGLAAVVVLIALGEVPNAGTTIIGGFSVPASAKNKDLGQAVADHLVYALHTLNDRLRPDVALVTAAGGGARDRGFKFVAAKDDTTNLDAELAKRPDIDLGPLKVPLNFLAAPVRGPARQLLGVRVISGSVHEGSPQTIVLARSTSGEAWQAPPEIAVKPKAPAQGEAPPDPKAKLPAQGDAPLDAAAARALAHRLAIDIVTSDRWATANGLTRSADALESFEKGWVAWRRFEIDDNLEALNEAIKHFREATTKDWRFALAHYRLARALQRARRPGAATEAFRASLQVNNHFGPGLVALASTLYDYDSYFATPPAPVLAAPSVQGGNDNLAASFRKHEAARLWQKVIRAPAASVSALDRAAAYAGLCLRASDLGLSLDDAAFTLEDIRAKFTDFDPGESYRVWVELRAAYRRLQEHRDKGKKPPPEEEARYEALLEEQRRIFAPITQAQEAAGKALKQLDALGADDAQKALQPILRMFQRLDEVEPTSKADAEKLKPEMAQHVDSAEELRVRLKQIPIQSYLTYFYCKRADKIYSTLGETRTNPDLRAGAARVAFLLGSTLERRYSAAAASSQPRWSCMTRAGVLRGPYSPAALRHYDRAMALSPDDGIIRCQTALTAYGLGDVTRLRALELDSEARLSLAEQHLADVRDLPEGETNDSFRRALAEYAAAIERNPNNVDALSGYAYAFWVWQYAWLQESTGVERPDGEVGAKARGHAERVVRLVEGKRPKPFEIVIRSRLGEVLLGLRRFEEARKVLEEALKLDAVKGHAVYNEVRWDLAQAHLCLALDHVRAGRGGQATAARAEAAKLLAEIKQVEHGEEARPLTPLIGNGKKTVACPPGKR